MDNCIAVEEVMAESAYSESSYLKAEDLVCGYGNKTIIKGISFVLEKGEIGCLLGPSGCGKSTVLRAIAGFLNLDQGSISVNQKVLSSMDTCIAPEKRNLGMVYQDYALFPHLSVSENITFGLKNISEAERSQTLAELLALVKLNGYENAFPAELSGGQQQRVALARSLAVNPDILLLDEPFSGLDAELRRELSLNVREILKQKEITAILVTHDQEEAFAVADRVGVMKSGQLIQWDTAYNLYHSPGHRFIADFIGRGSFITGKVIEGAKVETELGTLSGNSQFELADNQHVELLIRPDDVLIDDASHIRATIENKLFVGTNTLYGLSLPSGTTIETMLPSHEDYEIGSEHGIRVDAPHLIVFEK